MSEKRLQEIKDSIELQYKVQETNDLDSFNIFTNEEQELVEEIERLKLIIKAIKEQCDVMQYYEMNEYIRQLENEKADSKWLKRVAGSDKE